jgi:OOP family OmpA-OmpF porin
VIIIPATKIVVAALLVSSVVLATSLDNGDVVAPSKTAPLAAQSPQFRIQVQQGRLSLAGHTSSLRHEQAILAVATSSYPDSRVDTQFQALGIVPKTWSESTVLVLKLLTEASSAEAVMSGKNLRIRGVITDETAWQDRFEVFRESMPSDTVISTKTILVDPTISMAAICERAYKSLDLGPINFEESIVEFRSSAYPGLGRLIALAGTCRDSQILITGHTDASGDAAWNLALSRRRAIAVGDYIANSRISRERLVVSGVGSQEPVADNSTHYGRSLNRRIEIEFSFKD